MLFVLQTSERSWSKLTDRLISNSFDSLNAAYCVRKVYHKYDIQ